MPATILDAPPLPRSPAPKNSIGSFNVSFVDMLSAFPIVMEVRAAIPFSDNDFFHFCQTNRDLTIERDAQGRFIIMPPAGGESGSRNGEVTRVLGNWVVSDGKGRFFDSSTGFILPNGATRSPDAAWVSKMRLANLTPEEKKKFLPLCPDFVIEIRSPTDALATLKDKMEEYRQNGARLGWLLDVQNKQVLIYRNGETDVETLENPQSLSGETVLPGFVLDMADIWNPL